MYGGVNRGAAHICLCMSKRAATGHRDQHFATLKRRFFWPVPGAAQRTSSHAERPRPHRRVRPEMWVVGGDAPVAGTHGNLPLPPFLYFYFFGVIVSLVTPVRLYHNMYSMCSMYSMYICPYVCMIKYIGQVCMLHPEQGAHLAEDLGQGRRAGPAPPLPGPGANSSGSMSCPYLGYSSFSPGLGRPRPAI
jgi:hypothetical protein